VRFALVFRLLNLRHPLVMPPVSAVAAGNRLEFAVALALVWRKDNSSPVLAKFVAEVRLLPFSKLSYSVSVPPSWASNRRVTGVVIVWPRVAVFGTGHGGAAVNQDKQ